MKEVDQRPHTDCNKVIDPGGSKPYLYHPSEHRLPTGEQQREVSST